MAAIDSSRQIFTPNNFSLGFVWYPCCDSPLVVYISPEPLEIGIQPKLIYGVYISVREALAMFTKTIHKNLMFLGPLELGTFFYF